MDFYRGISGETICSWMGNIKENNGTGLFQKYVYLKYILKYILNSINYCHIAQSMHKCLKRYILTTVTTEK